MFWKWSNCQPSAAEVMTRLPGAVASLELGPDPDNLESGQLLCFSSWPAWLQNYISTRKSDWNTLSWSLITTTQAFSLNCWALNISRHFLTARENWPPPPDDLWVTGLLAGSGMIRLQDPDLVCRAQLSLAAAGCCSEIDCHNHWDEKAGPITPSNVLLLYKQEVNTPCQELGYERHVNRARQFLEDIKYTRVRSSSARCVVCTLEFLRILFCEF